MRVHILAPYMIMNIYSVMRKIDPAQLRGKAQPDALFGIDWTEVELPKGTEVELAVIRRLSMRALP